MKKNTFRKQLRNIVNKYYTCYLGIGKKIQKKIIFSSFDGKQYSCNPRAISERMHELFPDYKIVWYLKYDVKYNLLPDYVKIVKSKKEYLKEMASSFCIISNIQYEPDIYKRKKQFFIQTWHGDIGIKKILYDAWDDTNIKGTPVPIIDNIVTDVCISGSNLSEGVYRTAFKYDGFILKKGTPRNDVLCRNDISVCNRIKKLLNIGEKTKIILFAPTFRDRRGKKQESNIDLERVLKVLNSKSNDNWICLYRAHVGFELDIKPSERLINVSEYPDMADLLAISDILITDYSACAGDFLLREKLVVLAMFDYNEYTQNCRSFKIDPMESGFIVAYNQKGLEDILSKYTNEQAKENCQMLINKFGIVRNSDSSKEICSIINDEYKKRFVR